MSHSPPLFSFFRSIMLIAVVLTVLSSGCITQNPYKASIGGKDLEFRANLEEAAKVPVYPSEFALKKLLLDNDIERYKLVFISDEKENQFYAVDGFEVSYKMSLIHIVALGRQVPLDSFNVSNVSQAFGNATSSEPVILMLGPAAGANRTAVTVINNTVVLEGPDLSEEDRDYTDLDLAVDKMLLVLMGE